MKLSLILVALFSSTLAFAGNTNSQPQADKVVSSIILDLDGDKYADIAYLALPEKQAQEDLDLWVKLSTTDKYYKVEAVAVNMNDGAFGMATELRINAAGSLQVVSYNDAIGRSRWEETVTLAFRNDTLTLAGYTYSQRDTLDLSYSTCDVNVLSRKGIFESNQGRATFDVASQDALKLVDVSSINLQNTFLNEYCYTFDLGEDGDF